MKTGKEIYESVKDKIGYTISESEGHAEDAEEHLQSRGYQWVQGGGGEHSFEHPDRPNHWITIDHHDNSWSHDHLSDNGHDDKQIKSGRLHSNSLYNHLHKIHKSGS